MDWLIDTVQIFMQLAYQVRLSTLFHSNLLWSPLSATWSRSVVHPRSLFSRARLIEFIHRNLHVKRSITIDNVRQWCIRTRSSRSTKLLGYSCVCGLSTKPKVSESEYRSPRPRATRKVLYLISPLICWVFTFILLFLS